jgi:Kef-type K+ transport system membrane component KefB
MTLLTSGDSYILLEVFAFLALAQLVHTLTRRAGLPSIVADLTVGMAVGTYALGGLIDRGLGIPLFGLNTGLFLFADLSVILLLFLAGLGSGFTSLRKAGRFAVLTAIAGDLVPFVLVLLVFSRFYPFTAALLMAVAAAATSAAVVAVMIQEDRLHLTEGARFFMNVAALDDVVALVLLSVVLADIGGNFDLVQVTGGVGSALVAWVVLLLAAVIAFPRVLRNRVLREVENLPFALLFIVVGLVLALGFSPIIGAYIAGLAIAESAVAQRTRETAGVLVAIFGSLFFIVVGAEFNIHYLTDPKLIALALVLAGVATWGKVLGVYPFAWLHSRNAEKARATAFGMIPRGEIGLVVGAVGLAMGVLTQEMLGEIVVMAIVTTLVGAVLFRRHSSAFRTGSTEPVRP